MDLTDAQWDTIKDLIPAVKRDERPHRGRPWSSSRAALDGMRWRVATGDAWHFLPEKYGHDKTVFNRFRRWTRLEVFDAIVERLSKFLFVESLMFGFLALTAVRLAMLSA